MTFLEAIKGRVNFPLSDNSFKLALIDRELGESETYSISKKKAFELAAADCLVIVSTSPNVSESGYSISLSDRKECRAEADKIYSKYGELSNLSTPIIVDATNCW